VARDACCLSLAKRHGAVWGFAAHKGYGTPQHLLCVAQRGLLAGVHRTSVAPFRANSVETARASVPTRRLYVRIQTKLSQQASTGAKKQQRLLRAALAEGGEGIPEVAAGDAEEAPPGASQATTSPRAVALAVTLALPAHFHSLGKRKKRRRELKKGK
jgi:hypothetical protein